MITPTHVVVNALIARNRKNAGIGPLHEPTNARWFIIGGFAPDVGLYLLTAGAAVYFPLVRSLSIQDSLRYAFDDLFFNDPAWIAVQNTLHSPVVVGALFAAATVLSRPRLRAFSLGCLAHIALDIPVHHNDGPLVLFPFDWSTRINSPVSYYDPDHYGRIVADRSGSHDRGRCVPRPLLVEEHESSLTPAR